MMLHKHAAIVLSGCGVQDGSEIHESVMLLLACAQHHIEVDGFAPVINQSFVVNHLNQSQDAEHRSVYKESARIMRGNVRPLEDYHPEAYDMLLFPGGYGAVINLSNFGLTESLDFSVHPDVAKAITDTYGAKKPMLFLCISPLLAARVLGHIKPKLTLGTDMAYLRKLSALGAEAISTPSRQVVWDSAHKIGSSPAYMLAQSVADVYVEASTLLDKVMQST